MTTWGEVNKGDRVQLGARVLLVEKAKRKGKRVRIVVHDKLGRFDREVKAKDAVTILALNKLGDGAVGADSLHDRHGAQQRWANEGERKNDEPKQGPRHGSLWDRPADKIERTLEQVLGAKLVDESIDGGRTYAVPPVDYSTVAAHLLIMHGTVLDPATDAASMVQHHTDHHNSSTDFKVPHYHSETRP